MQFIRKSAIALLFAVAVLLVSTPVQTARAADPVESITMSPTSKTYKVDPGQTFDDTLTVVNDGDTAYDFTVYAAPYSVNNSAYEPNFTSTVANADAYTWVQFKQVLWHAEAHETIKIPYTVYVSKKASPGGHYGVLFAETQPTTSNDVAATLGRKKRVGAILYATVSGDVKLSGKVAGTKINWFQTGGSLTITSSVNNTGNSDFIATVTYQVMDIFGSVKYDFTGEYAVLPSTTRDIHLGWANTPWFGLYKVHVTTAFLDQKESAESYVLVMPMWLVWLIGGVVLTGGVYAGWRHFSRSRR